MVFQDRRPAQILVGTCQRAHWPPRFGAGSLASAVVKPYAIYSLDGKETTAEQLWGASKVKSRFKAKWSKDGKTLDLSLIQRDASAQERNSALTIREHWSLLEGGEVLRMQHSVEVPSGADTITLLFRKSPDKPPTRQP